ncbi:metalloendopeptidase, partial [Trifolium pratense]
MPMPMAMAASTSTSVIGIGTNTNLSLPPHRYNRPSSISTRFRNNNNNRFFLSSPRDTTTRRRVVVQGGLGLRRTNKPDVWKHYSSFLSQPTATPLFQSCTSCCLASTKKRRSNLSRFLPGAFFHNSSFGLSKDKLRFGS